MSAEVIDSDSDESMRDAPETKNVNEKNSVTTSDSSDDSSSESESSESSNLKTTATYVVPPFGELLGTTKTKKAFLNHRKKSSSSKNRSFKPPPGFRLSQNKTQPSKAIMSALANLEGKKVFHITAPPDLPISEIKEIAFSRAVAGQSIVTHKGVDYGLVESTGLSNKGSETLLVYDQKSNSFVQKPELAKIESYNIQEIVQLPGANTLIPSLSLSSSSSAPGKEQAGARPQPKHLKMRFHPVGSSNLPPETVGSSSESEAEELTASQGSQDRKRKPGQGSGGDEETAKKSKKEQRIEPTEAEAETDNRHEKERKKSSKHRNETSQERRARKEEKKRRKAEKGK